MSPANYVALIRTLVLAGGLTAAFWFGLPVLTAGLTGDDAVGIRMVALIVWGVLMLTVFMQGVMTEDGRR